MWYISSVQNSTWFKRFGYRNKECLPITKPKWKVQCDAQTKKPAAGDCVTDKFDVVRQLGEGGFGAVYEVVDRRDKKHYAMKVELEIPAPDEPGLDTEGAVLKRLQGYPHVLFFTDEGKHGSFAYLVMQLAGSNLSELRRLCNGKYIKFAV